MILFSMKTIDAFLTQLRQNPALQWDSEFCKQGPEDLEFYGQDWSQILTPQASCILFPRTTAELSVILKMAFELGVSVVPSGGRTGLSGGAVALNGEVVVSSIRMNQIAPVQLESLSVQVGAGVVTERLHDFVKEHGLTWPVDFASKGSSTIGGNLATNAGGIRVIRYGNTRNWVLGITLVTMDGQIHELNHDLEKNNTGLDFRQLIVGSEGILGFIAEATLKLCPLPRSQTVFLFSLKSMKEVLELFRQVRPRIPNLSAFETWDRACMDQVVRHFNLTPPFALGSAESFVLMEIENAALDECESWLSEIFDKNLVLEGAMAESSKDFAHFWKFRESIAESILHHSVVHQEDVSVRVSDLERFFTTARERYQNALQGLGSTAELFFFGHIGDGNLHIFIRKPEKQDVPTFRTQMKTLDLLLFKTLQEFSGSISAEHGIGVLKKHALPFSRSPAELQWMAQMKSMFDPRRLLNPGKVID